MAPPLRQKLPLLREYEKNILLVFPLSNFSLIWNYVTTCPFCLKYLLELLKYFITNHSEICSSSTFFSGLANLYLRTFSKLGTFSIWEWGFLSPHIQLPIFYYLPLEKKSIKNGVNVCDRNLGHNILELYNVLIQIRLTASKTKRDV